MLDTNKGSGDTLPLGRILFKIMKTEYQKLIINATATNPCVHCGKPDWCYRLGDLSVCNRDIEPAPGWYKTSKTDQDGHYFYAPDHQKPLTKPSKKTWIYTDIEGNKLVQVTKSDPGNGGKKKYYQSHWNGKSWVQGLKGIERSQIPVYRYQEIREAIAHGETIFLVAGESCADALWDLGLAATTNIAGEGKWKASDTACLEGAAEIVLCPDRDTPGIKHSLKVSEYFPDALWLYAPPSQFFWLSDRLPASQGLDIKNWIDSGSTKEQILNQITDLSPNKYSESLPLHEKIKASSNLEVKREVVVEAEEIYTQKAVDCLFSEKEYITIDEQLYAFNGTHYQLCHAAREQRRILEWTKVTPVEVRGKWKYALAKPETVKKIWQWVLTSFSIDPEQINPPGINCLNGTIKLSWKGKKVSYQLIDHDSEFYFTYVANFKYDPDADDRDCNRMLQALEPQQQIVFLRTIAASLDLNMVRKYQGRSVKALLCQGSGNNGKDTLREAVRCLLGQSMTAASVTDFQQYDGGRKFPLTKIEHSKINWSSENSQFARLDSLQGLKAAITGETIDIEAKNSMDYPINPKGVFLFNVNESPLLEGGTEAIASRWAVLSFNKTFKKNARAAYGEIEADSRFRYDPDFLERAVCPALLNKILEQLQSVVDEGIDYVSLEGALKKIQEQSNHLWQFINEVGIVEVPGARLYLKDLWVRLEAWYLENGTLEIIDTANGTKRIWHDQPRKSDRNISAPNQLFRRFKDLFPTIEKKRHTTPDVKERVGQNYISGLAIAAEANIEAVEANIEANIEAKTTIYIDIEAVEAKLALLAQLLSEVKKFPENQRLKGREIVNEFTQNEEIIDEFPKKITEKGDFASTASTPLYSKGFENENPENFASTASTFASTPDEKRSQIENNQTNSNFSDRPVESVLNISVNNAVESPSYQSSNSSTNKIIGARKIDWVRTKDGLTYQIDSQNGLKLRGHQPGMLNGYKDIWLDECIEIIYTQESTQVRE